MKDDYLWDKSGEADPEIQHLERVLAELRHRGGAPELMPAFESLRRTRPRISSKVMALAAVLAFAALALGVFAVMQRQPRKQKAVGTRLAMANPGTPAQAVTPEEGDAGGSNKIQPVEGQLAPVDVYITNRKRQALYYGRRRNVNRRLEAPASEREQAEGLMAKEQLLKALEITSSKLNSVQKKVQGQERQGPSS